MARDETQFEQLAQQGTRDNIWTDFWALLSSTKKWWLLPLVVILMMLGGLMLLSGTAVAPFIYTLF
jgi:hypothetical protein